MIIPPNDCWTRTGYQCVLAFCIRSYLRPAVITHCKPPTTGLLQTTPRLVHSLLGFVDFTPLYDDHLIVPMTIIRRSILV